MSSEPLLIVGDFNIHVDIPRDPNVIRFLDLLSSIGLHQHVDKPTHTSGHTLDLIITWNSDTFLPTRPLTDYLFLDHITVICDLTLGRRIPPTEKQVSYREIKTIDKTRLREELLLSDLCSNSPDTRNELVKCYNDTLTRTLNRTHLYVRRSSNLDH